MEPLKTIGILGGMSSAATGEYYQLINQKVKEIRGGHHIAEVPLFDTTELHCEMAAQICTGDVN